jgi:Sodium:solute symporter family
MIVVGYFAGKRVKDASDFFTAGGSMPWWLSGISHHMSGYSSAVFVGYATLAYMSGITVYFWWAASFGLSLLRGIPLAIPILLGLLLPFRRSGPSAAIGSCIAGAVAFGTLKLSAVQPWLESNARYDNAITIGLPLLASIGILVPCHSAASADLLKALDSDKAANRLTSEHLNISVS